MACPSAPESVFQPVSRALLTFAPCFSSGPLILARAASSASISRSICSGKCGTSRKLSVRRRAIVLRIPSSGTRSYEPAGMPICSSDRALRGSAAAGAALAAAAGAALAAGAPDLAASTSDLTTRPCGPEPLMLFRSRPAADARRRASGEAKTREPSAATGAAGAGAAGAGAAAGAAAAGFGASTALGASTFGAGAGLSPSPASFAISALTLTFSVPAGTRMASTTPSSTASTSMVALSVSISAITSPALTVSPTLTCHLARVPSSMVGDRAGIRMSIDIELLPQAFGTYSRAVVRDTPPRGGMNSLAKTMRPPPIEGGGRAGLSGS